VLRNVSKFPLPFSRILLACAAVLLAAAARGASAPDRGSEAPSDEFVRVQGRHFVDATGQRIFLRGVNLGNWLVPEGYMFDFKRVSSPQQIELLVAECLGDVAAARFWTSWREHYITREDIKSLKRLGLNSVRVPITWRLFASECFPHRMEGEGWALLDRLISWCREEKLWVIIDLHCAPNGQTGDNIDDSRGTPMLWEDADAQQLTVDLWKEIARRYKDSATVLGYDLLNEPIAHYFDTARFNPMLAPLYTRIAEAVRKEDAQHVLFLGGAQWDTNLPAAKISGFSNVAYTFHLYWTDPARKSIEPYLKFRDENDVPLWLGESGENDDTWVADFRKLLESEDIGWCFWPYKKMKSTAGIAVIATPRGWQQIQRFAEAPRGTFKEIRDVLPPLEERKRIFAELLENIDVSKCTLNTGYVQALGLNAKQ
jgi:endoglucanase